MRSALALSALSLLVAGCADAQAPAGPPASTDAIVLADGRGNAPDDGAPEADIPAWDAHPALVQASAAARAYWQAQEGGLVEEEYRVMDVAEGAFTAPGVQQRAILYLMSLTPRCCPKMGLAVVEGDRLVRHVVFEGVAQTLRGVPDLDGDGRDELVFTGAFGMGGSESSSLTLASFGESRLVARGGTGISESGCAAMHDDLTAVRVLARPGPTFTAERFTGSCETGVWQADGPAEALELDPPYEGETGYVDLPVR